MQASTPARGSVWHGEQDRGGQPVWVPTHAGTQSHGQAHRIGETWSEQVEAEVVASRNPSQTRHRNRNPRSRSLDLA